MGRERIIEAHDFDWFRITESMRVFLGNNTKTSMYRPKYRAAIERIQNKKTGGLVADRISVISELLAG